MEFINEAFTANWISPAGPHIAAFEEELANYNGIAHCAALSSGTAAIHLALIILGVTRGDEVICSSFTFSGSCNPIAYQGAVPVFVDSETDSWNMNPSILEDAIKDRIAKGQKPKAIILVHLYGMPAKMEELMTVARKYGIPVIEDAAEAIGSTYRGGRLGTFGDIGIFSFNGNKIITTSGGGALVSNNEVWVKKARFLATQARDQTPHYEHSEIGYNYRLSNICAAIGRGQLEVLNERVQQRRAVFDHYTQTFKRVNGMRFQPEFEGSYSNRWLTTLTFDEAMGRGVNERIRIKLDEQNIESRPLWKPMHLQPVFKDAPFYGSGVSEKLFTSGLCLPSGSSMTKDDLDRVTEIVLHEVTS